jgi:hypothetical protein
MSHNYLFDTYRYLQQRLDEIRPRLTERLLKERYEGKLPRRLRKQSPPLEAICTETGKAH